ncbi:hypothetical protein M2135_002718 [Parabacteroides sp. PF5-9]|nr:hypothetical protein [Parabacteroides sp. PF5-9]
MQMIFQKYEKDNQKPLFLHLFTSRCLKKTTQNKITICYLNGMFRNNYVKITSMNFSEPFTTQLFIEKVSPSVFVKLH